MKTIFLIGHITQYLWGTCRINLIVVLQNIHSTICTLVYRASDRISSGIIWNQFYLNFVFFIQRECWLQTFDSF